MYVINGYVPGHVIFGGVAPAIARPYKVNKVPVAFFWNQGPARGFQTPFSMVDCLLNFLANRLSSSVHILGCVHNVGIIHKCKANEIHG